MIDSATGAGGYSENSELPASAPPHSVEVIALERTPSPCGRHFAIAALVHEVPRRRGSLSSRAYAKKRYDSGSQESQAG
jgi:hypothetical protein